MGSKHDQKLIPIPIPILGPDTLGQLGLYKPSRVIKFSLGL